ncbi:WD40-repeat-containing domain protein [Emericellopsis atlantica]|uniref:WD40-repeat-containing domain protein n=1 Tax=Emericellopsis atlantica TaxID=2614577 RepID=A0A9P7ZKP1_9HYPO|nr:WD40-repeat-containing domain protein [Emericellopsis atlantica]KAG9253894.1 WD40-repeat-containing domain protein [Emericellopsis atlantica]
MAKRKRNTASNGEPASELEASKKTKAVDTKSTTPKPTSTTSTETLQIVVGFYDGVLHGLTAQIHPPTGKQKKQSVEFADTFLLTAHTKAIRCLAVSPVSNPIPGQTQKVILASGSNDSKINLYDLSAHPPKEQDEDPLKFAAPRPIKENKRNRELGNLEHHASAVTALDFPTRGKLMSASEDSTVAVTRTRDWALIGTIKAPIAKAEGRPSGDTAAHDGTPQGVNDFAVHPSMKLMMSVSKGERKVRPWNLMTGKRAKALNYERELLQQIGEGKYTSGEGKRVAWGHVDGDDEFAVGFDRDVVVFRMAGEPKCRILSSTRTKIHQVRYISISAEGASEADADSSEHSLLAVSTEDGRIIFASTREAHLTPIEGVKNTMAPGTARTVCELGGKADGVTGRIKDFVVLQSGKTLYVVGGSSDGQIRLWAIGVEELRGALTSLAAADGGQPLGALIGTYGTENRVMCMAAYLMIPHPDGDEEQDDFEDFEGLDAEEEDDDDSSDE